MLSRRGQWLSRLTTRPSFAGTGLLERMRSTTFALLGITAAMGLGLVAVISQQGWPLLPAAPLPEPSVGQGKVHDAVALRSHPGSAAPRPLAGAQVGQAAADRGAEAPNPGSHLSGSRQLAVAPPSADPAPGATRQPAPAEPTPVTPSPDPSPTPAPAPPPAPVAPPAASPPAPAPPPVTATTKDRDRGNAYGKHKSPGGSKDKSHSYESQAPAPPVVESDAATDEDAVQPPEDDSPSHEGKGHGHAYGHSDE